MTNWTILSIRARLITIVGAIIFLGFTLTNVISLHVSTQTLRSTILENELPLTSSNIYAEVQRDLLQPIFLSAMMAKNEFIIDWLKQGESDPDLAIRYLHKITTAFGVFTSFLISETTRTYYHHTGVAQIVDERDPEDVWYFRTRELAADYEINIDFNQAQNNVITIFVNHRIVDGDGRFLGVTGVGLELKSVASTVSNYSRLYRNAIYFVNGEGRITVRSDGATIPSESIVGAPGIGQIADDILKSRQGFFEYSRDGETFLLSTRFIEPLGWHVIVEQPESVALRNIWATFVTNSLIGATIVMISIVSIAYAINTYQAKLEQLATTDKLTGLANRQAFDVAVDKALAQSNRGGTRPFIILFDLDHFKRVNDTHGHLAGDEVIRTVASIARQHVTPPLLLCRWGGEEIIALLPTSSTAGAVGLAERIRAAVAEAPLLAADPDFRMTISAGVAEAIPGDDADRLLARADRALYHAKQVGRNLVVFERNMENMISMTE